jgi:glycosyltransferase involved in cell wall biosynthesis
MRIAIDASNIRSGGGVTHLVELLRAADPLPQGITGFVIWACATTLARIEDRPWIEKRTDPVLERNYIRRAIWQRTQLGRLAADAGADLMFVPGGSIISTLRPTVTMCRNMLPFEFREMKRFGFSMMTMKLFLLRLTQIASFRKADGTIFLTQYARDAVLAITGPLKGLNCTIPHGINDRFRHAPRPQRSLAQASAEDPLRIIYVSIVDVYKHQWSVAEAVARLRAEGLPVRLDLFGPATSSAMLRLTKTLKHVDPEGAFIRYWGAVDYRELDTRYAAADICVYASSCENLPNILVEGMAAALPIASSNRGPMPEILGDAGLYFDPENPDNIADALRQFVLNVDLRAKKAVAAGEAVRAYSWKRCANDTMAFLVEVGRRHGKSPAVNMVD